MTTLDATDTTAPGLAERIRTETDAAHRNTEQSRFVGDLLAGKLTPAAHAALIGQTYLVYLALEAAGRAKASDPVAAPFIGDELLRTEALEADLEFLLGAGLARPGRRAARDRRYIERLDEVAFDLPDGFRRAPLHAVHG